eukprot:3921989-Alexandrium_andersonii.AAC.1
MNRAKCCALCIRTTDATATPDRCGPRQSARRRADALRSSSGTHRLGSGCRVAAATQSCKRP